MLGVYVSFDEKQNGSFDEAVDMSNDEYIIWKDRSSCKQKLNYPARILIKIKGEEKYYSGTLLLMRPYVDFDPTIFAKDTTHRPSLWRADKGEAKTVFFISGLNKINKPPQIANIAPMQRPIYIDF
jgi:hypothetical protein